MWYVYVIMNEKNELYIGFTGDLEKRLKSHNASENVNTRGHVWHYVYYEAYANKTDAILRERRLKNHGQSKRQLKTRIVHSLEMRKKLGAGLEWRTGE